MNGSSRRPSYGGETPDQHPSPERVPDGSVLVCPVGSSAITCGQIPRRNGSTCISSPRWATLPPAERAPNPAWSGPSAVLKPDAGPAGARRLSEYLPGLSALCSGGLTVQDVTKSGSTTTSPLDRRRYSPGLARSNASGTDGSVKRPTCATVDRHERVNRHHDPSELDVLLGVALGTEVGDTHQEVLCRSCRRGQSHPYPHNARLPGSLSAVDRGCVARPLQLTRPTPCLRPPHRAQGRRSTCPTLIALG